MNPEEFAGKIKAKYPQYQDKDNLELAQAFVNKFPVYKNQVDFSGGQRQAQSYGESLLTNKPTTGFKQELVRSLPASIGAIPGASIGAIKGAALGAPFGPLGAATGGIAGGITGAGVGGGVGEALRQIGARVEAYRRGGKQSPISESAREIKSAAIEQGAGQAIGGAIGKGAKIAAPSIISLLSRIENPIVERAIARPGVLGNKALRTPEALENAIKGFGAALKEGRSILGQKLDSIADVVAAKLGNSKVIDTLGIATKLQAKLSKSGFDVKGLPKGAVTRPLSNDSKLIIKDLKSKNLTFRDALNLRRKIDDLVDYSQGVAPKIDDTQTGILKEARRELNEQILKVDPRFKKANDSFKQAANAYNDIEKDILGGKIETIQSRITRLFNKGTVERRLVEKADRFSANASNQLDTILDAITAQKFTPIINPGVRRAVANTGGGLMGPVAGAVGSKLFGFLPTVATGGLGLAATSPRLAGLAIRSAQGVSRLPQVARQAASLPARAGVAASLAALAAARKRKQERP